MCFCICALVLVPSEARRVRHVILWTKVTGSCEPTDGCAGNKTVVLCSRCSNAEPSPQPLVLFFLPAPCKYGKRRKYRKINSDEIDENA